MGSSGRGAAAFARHSATDSGYGALPNVVYRHTACLCRVAPQGTSRIEDDRLVAPNMHSPDLPRPTVPHSGNAAVRFPVIAFKAATVSGARYYGSSVSMTGMRQFIFFKDDMSKHSGQMLAHITGEPIMREDVVRVGRGGTDLRYRPEFPEWSATLHVTYVPTMLTRFSMLSLIEAGGLGVGVGEWRPERNGDFGTYQIDTTREVIVEGSK